MSQKRHSILSKFNIRSLTDFLTSRAEQHTMTRGHTLSSWFMAKKKLGKNATRASCIACSRTVYVFPSGQTAAGAYSTDPAIAGDALFYDCEWKGKLSNGEPVQGRHL